MSDTIAKLRDLLLNSSKAGRLRDLLDSIYGAASTGAEAYGAASSPMSAEHSGLLGGLLMDMSPLGDAKSAYDGVQSAREGDYLGAGLGALGALPMVPNLAGVMGGKLARARNPLSPTDISETLAAQTFGRGTGHFGTGEYFVSQRAADKGALDSFLNMGRDMKSGVVPEGMFTPRSPMAADQAHEALMLVNDAVYADKLTPQFVEKVRRKMESAGIPFSEEWLRKSLAEPKNIMNRNRGYGSTGADSASTRYMKNAGFNGVDVSDISTMDNTKYGTVIYR